MFNYRSRVITPKSTPYKPAFSIAISLSRHEQVCLTALLNILVHDVINICYEH